MEIAGASSPQVLRKLNARRVLEHAWRADAFTASDVMAATGLTRSTVIGVCDELVRQGWLVELVDARAVGDYTKGRPARRYALRDRAGVVVGVDAGYEHIAATVADLRGRARRSRGGGDRRRAPGSRRAPGRRRDPPRARTRRGARCPRRERRSRPRRCSRSRSACPRPSTATGPRPPTTGSGASRIPATPSSSPTTRRSSPSRTTRTSRRSRSRPRPTGGGRDADSYIALLVGEGIGAGLMIDGRLVRGRRGGAGEMRFLDRVEGVGSPDGLALLARQWAVEAIAAGPPRRQRARPPRPDDARRGRGRRGRRCRRPGRGRHHRPARRRGSRASASCSATCSTSTASSSAAPRPRRCPR